VSMEEAWRQLIVAAGERFRITKVLDKGPFRQERERQQLGDRRVSREGRPGVAFSLRGEVKPESN